MTDSYLKELQVAALGKTQPLHVSSPKTERVRNFVVVGKKDKRRKGIPTQDMVMYFSGILVFFAIATLLNRP